TILSPRHGLPRRATGRTSTDDRTPLNDESKADRDQREPNREHSPSWVLARDRDDERADERNHHEPQGIHDRASDRARPRRRASAGRVGERERPHIESPRGGCRAFGTAVPSDAKSPREKECRGGVI